MVITFIEQRKRQKYLILILGLVILVIFFIVWFGFFGGIPVPPTIPITPIRVPPPKIEINWQVLEDLRLQEFQPFPEIPAWEEEVGRENPFLPY